MLSDAVPFAVAHWALDEASGTRVDSINGYDLTDNNTVGSATGLFGNAADFEEGNSESLNRSTDDADLSGGDVKLFFRAWVKIESLTSFNGILSSWGSDGNRSYTLFVNTTSNRFVFTVTPDGAQSSAVDLPANNFGAPSAGVWYLIHAWHDSVANEIGISVNGGTADTVSHSTGVFNGTEPFALGVLGTGSLYWDGLIEDVVVLRGYVLDATERTADYNSGAGVAFEDWAGGGGGATVPILMRHYLRMMGSG